MDPVWYRVCVSSVKVGAPRRARYRLAIICCTRIFVVILSTTKVRIFNIERKVAVVSIKSLPWANIPPT